MNQPNNSPNLKQRIRLYRKIYRRNPHLWDITEYDPARYYPYEVLELRRNPNLIVSFHVEKDFRWKCTPHTPTEPKPHEATDIQIVWDFLKRCVDRMNQVQAECPEFQAIVHKCKELCKEVSKSELRRGGQWKGKVKMATNFDETPEDFSK